MKTERYKLAPIVEAIIDIQFDQPENLNLDALAGIGEVLGERYPKRQPISFVTSTFSPTGVASTPLTVIGYRFNSADGKYIVQIRNIGFTFSRLSPYESWEPFRDEAKRLWDIFKSVAKPTKLTRAAVRYINQILLPPPIVQLEEYFQTYPQISGSLPQNLQSYAMQLIIPVPEWDVTMSLIQATLPATGENLPLNLDIDIFKHKPEGFSSETEIWKLFEELRDKRNLVFEGCITDKTRELFYRARTE
jgi:uncharacterized protein (TIGR04255 family)